MTVHGKVVVVTGAGSGIGLETARILVARGAQVGIVCRTAETAATACESIAAPPGRVETFVADLSAQAAVRRLADTIVRRYPRVDVLINNAAAIYSRPVLSDDGIEMQLAVNHLAGYLLARLLLEHLRAAGRARIVNVTSRTHAWASIDFDDLGHARRYSGPSVYNQSKLANVLFTFALARRMAGTHVTANCVAPGLVRTRIGSKRTTPVHAMLHAVTSMWGTTAAKGAEGLVHLASAPELACVNGQYFLRTRPVRAAAHAYDEALAERLWRVSASLTGMPAE